MARANGWCVTVGMADTVRARCLIPGRGRRRSSSLKDLIPDLLCLLLRATVFPNKVPRRRGLLLRTVLAVRTPLTSHTAVASLRARCLHYWPARTR
eukprot:1550466-Alexandrium_andersonii.AAC.1